MATVNGSASAAAYARLRREIVRGVLAPGERFSEQMLTERYGFGKAPIRAALLRLRHDGLIEGLPRQACRVTVLTTEDGAELSAMRLLLEPEAARLAAERRTLAQLRKIERAANRSVQQRVQERAEDFLTANRNFHIAVGEASGNRRLAASIERFVDEGERVLYAFLRARPIAAHFGEANVRIAGAVARQDPDEAASLMRARLTSGKALFFDALDFLPMTVAP
jgi:DNA-binding GntR family transcriptional regulator